MVFFPRTVYAAKVTDATSISAIPATVFPGWISQGRIMNTAATTPIPKATAFRRSIFSDVNRWASTMVNSGFRQINEAAVAALHRSTPSWKQSILTGMPIHPTRNSQPRSAGCMMVPLRLTSLIPKGARMIPPIRNRRNVSCTESKLAPALFRATSMVPNRNAVNSMQIITFFIFCLTPPPLISLTIRILPVSSFCQPCLDRAKECYNCYLAKSVSSTLVFFWYNH